MAERWAPTHRITTTSRVVEVALLDGVAYTQHEWDHEVPADFEVADGEWLFQGQPFAGEVSEVARG